MPKEQTISKQKLMIRKVKASVCHVETKMKQFIAL